MAQTNPDPSLARLVFSRPGYFLAFGFGSGLAPAAPGTFGTLAAVPLYLVLRELPLGAYLLILALLFGLGVWLCGVVARGLGTHDHPGIVWDEIVGYLLTMVAAPRHWGWILAGFVLFRLFDVTKPFPIGLLDRRVSGGLGIMLDDLAAGLFALVSLQLLVAWSP